MPTTLQIPARTERHCAPCEHHKCVGSFHVRSGPGSWREYNCMHPEAYDEDASVPLTPEQQLRAAEIRAIVGKDGRHIGRTEKQPDWCPLRREPANDQAQPHGWAQGIKPMNITTHGGTTDASDKPTGEAVLAGAAGYTDICKLIDDAPITWAGGILMHAVKACKRARFFASDDDLAAFATKVAKESSPHND